MSNAAGMFSGALMTLSLLAVPCVAVFGLPSVGQAVTDAEAKDGVALGEADDLGAPVPSSAATADAPAFAPLVDAGHTTAESAFLDKKSTAAPPHLDPTSDRRGAAANMAVGLEESPRAQPAVETAEAPHGFPPRNVFESVEDTAAAAATRAVQAATWEGVVEKLGGLGVRDFHLTNGESPGQFYFTCSIKDAGRNLTRRFEAEGNSAVLAAEDVLAQVEACLDTH